MTQQSRKEILKALQDLIETNVTTFNYVDYKTEFQMFADIPHTDRPACIIESGTRQSRHNITSTHDNGLAIAIFIVGDPTMTDDDLYDLDEEVLDAINGNITLDGTCLYVLSTDADPPRLWPRGDMKMIEQRIRVEYRRDV